MVVSANGRRLYSTDLNSSIGRLWDLDSGKVLATFAEPDATNQAAAFNPQGTRLVTFASNHVLRQIDAETGRGLAVLADNASSVQFFGSGRGVVVITNKNELRTFDTTLGALIASGQISKEDEYVSVTVSGDGRRVLGKSSGQIRVMDATNGREVTVIRPGVDDIGYLQLSSDGRRVLVPGEHDLTIYEIDTGRRVTRLDATWPSQYSVNFDVNRDGSRILARIIGGSADLFDGNSGARLARLSDGAANLDFLADGTRVLSSHRDGSLQLFDAARGQLIAKLRLAQTKGRGHHVSDDGRVVVAVVDQTLIAFDTSTGNRLATYGGLDGVITDMSFSGNGTRFAVSFEGGGGIVYDTRTGAQMGAFSAPPEGGTRLVLDATGQRVVAYAVWPEAALFETNGWNRVGATPPHRYRLISMAFSPDGKRIATGGYDNNAVISDATTGAQLHVLEGHKDDVNAVAFSSDGSLIVTASDDGTARVWDAGSGQQLKVLETGSRLGDARFSSDGRTLATTAIAYGGNGEVRRWRVGTWEPVTDTATSRAGRDAGSAATSPDGRYTAIFSKNEMRVVDTATGAEQLTIRLKSGSSYSTDEMDYISDPFENVVVSEDGRTAASTSSGAVWRMLWTTQDYVDYSKEALPRCLTPAERKALYLDPEPPLWCIELGKWPYQSQVWKQWATYIAAGKNVPMPTDD